MDFLEYAKTHTIKECAREYNLPYATARYRIKRAGVDYIREKEMDGRSKTRLYHIYKSMKGRCYNENDKNYRFYGAKGVSVCEAWKTDYNVFKKWAETNGYAEDLTLDRIDFTRDYSPDNCRWVNRRTQSNNTRRNIFIVYKGRTKTLAEWQRELDFNYTAVAWRLRKGWSFERAIATSVKSVKRQLTFKGETHGVKEWGNILGLNEDKMKYLLHKKGMTIAQIVARYKEE